MEPRGRDAHSGPGGEAEGVPGPERESERMPIRGLLAGAYTALVLLATLIPPDLLPADETRAGPDLIPHADKLVHGGLFFGFAWAWTWAGPRRDRRRAGRVLAAGIALAAFTELAQGLSIVDRDPNLLDTLADIAGLGIGLGAAWLAGIGLDAPPD